MTIREGNALRGDAKAVIGWREWVMFPDLGGARINAKIDTGAKTSAIHAHDIIERRVKGAPYVEFRLHPQRRRKKPEILCCAPVHDRRVIRSSNGVEERRVVIQTSMTMGAATWLVDLTLANRDAMGYRLLIGRDAIGGRFTVDPSASYRLGKRLYLK